VERSDIGGSWVLWTETRAFFDCGPKDRVYALDRAASEIQFGDGLHGQIPPAGVDNIRAFRYRTGGGAVGNVAAGAITSLVTAVAGVDSVLNPTAAAGGSDVTDTEQMLAIGPHQLSHRGRAVSTTDFEELACEASRQVAKARCLAATNLVSGALQRMDPCDSRQRHEARPARGWVSLIIVPQSTDPQPCPSLQLRRVVAAYLRDRAPGLVASGGRIVVRPPDYVVVSVKAVIRVVSIDQVAQVEREARDAIETFLHPLRGGSDGSGWEFGRPLSKSDVFAVLERVPNLDRVESVSFTFGERTSADGVPIGPNQLIAGGKHELEIVPG
jgi:predicted phage baseplate assembly protein